MKLLTFADGVIRLGGEALPGILSSLTIDGKVRYDKQKVDGASGKRKTPQGFEDQEVKAALTLLTDKDGDCYEKLARLSPFFRKTDNQANPEIYALVNRHAGARGIRQIVFDSLSSAETSRDDVITVTLGFTEHRPPIVRKEAAESKTLSTGEAGREGSGGAQPEPEPAIEINVK